MQTSTTHYVDATTPVRAYILEVGEDKRRVMYLEVGALADRATFIFYAPEFLDRLSNEADRLCREFVGDVPEVEPAGTDCYGSLE